MYKDHRISVIIPAHNEAQSIAPVVDGLSSLINEVGSPLVDEIIVCDNGSTDNTSLAASQAGATVVYEPRLGYGSACLKAIASLCATDIVVFVDGDSSVAIDEMRQLLDPIVNKKIGNDSGQSCKHPTGQNPNAIAQPQAELTIGVRKADQQEHGALLPQQKLGNVLACSLIQWLWAHPTHDLGPFRAITYTALKSIDMQDRRFGWTVEMQVKAIQKRIAIVEVPVSVYKRVGKSKISGTVKGTICACYDIFGTIFKLKLAELSKGKNSRRLQKKPFG